MFRNHLLCGVVSVFIACSAEAADRTFTIDSRQYHLSFPASFEFLKREDEILFFEDGGRDGGELRIVFFHQPTSSYDYVAERAGETVVSVREGVEFTGTYSIYGDVAIFLGGNMSSPAEDRFYGARVLKNFGCSDECVLFVYVQCWACPSEKFQLVNDLAADLAYQLAHYR